MTHKAQDYLRTDRYSVSILNLYPEIRPSREFVAVHRGKSRIVQVETKNTERGFRR